MTDRETMFLALNALEDSMYPQKKQFNAIVALKQALAQPEQEEPLPLVDIGVDVTPEGTHVVACYNKPDAVQEMFYSQFHPLAKLDQSKYSDIVSDGGFDPRNKFDAQPEQIMTPISPDQYERLCGTCGACTGKPWVGLTDDEINKIVDLNTSDDGGFDIWCDGIAVARIVCAKIKEKNT